MIWYIAGQKQEWGREVRDGLEGLSETVIARWLDATKYGTGTQSEEERSAAAVGCFEDAMGCEALVIIANPDLSHGKGGKHVEWGIALGRGVPTHIIGGRENVFAWLPWVRRHETRDAFLTYVYRNYSRGAIGICENAAHKWDRRFLELAERVSTWSKDPSTKTGAVIVRPDRSICSLGYNGFPRGMKDSRETYANRELKYDKVIHCEMNAVMTAREPVTGFTLYTTGPSCSRCAVHMIQAGITRFVFWEPTEGQRARWNTDRTLDYFKEAGVSVRQIPRLI